MAGTLRQRYSFVLLRDGVSAKSSRMKWCTENHADEERSVKCTGTERLSVDIRFFRVIP